MLLTNKENPVNLKMRKPLITISAIDTNRARAFLKGLGFKKEQIDKLLASINSTFRANKKAKLKAAKDKKLKNSLKDKIALLPNVIIKKCPCPHNCGNNYVNGNNGLRICSNVFDAIKKLIPHIDTTGENPIKVWQAVLDAKLGYTTTSTPWQLTEYLRTLSVDHRKVFIMHFNQKGSGV